MRAIRLSSILLALGAALIVLPVPASAWLIEPGRASRHLPNSCATGLAGCAVPAALEQALAQGLD